jgi:hypothetical protein
VAGRKTSQSNQPHQYITATPRHGEQKKRECLKEDKAEEQQQLLQQQHPATCSSSHMHPSAPSQPPRNEPVI